jgi:phage shock protein PspC (stress-responsive transcriptional regulator)
MAEVNIKRVKSSEIEFKDKLVSINRVTKVTKGGRTFSFSAVVVVGNENGVVGYGLGKAKEVAAAIAKGVDDAKKNLVRVPILKGTVPHEQTAKYSGGGLAEYFDVDPTLIRVIYAALSLFTVGFPGVLLYIILMILMPNYNQIDNQ